MFVRMIIAFLLLIDFANAKVVTSSMIVDSLLWEEGKKNYRVTFEMHSAIYFANEIHFSCLSSSLKNKKKVSVKFDTKNGKLADCQ